MADAATQRDRELDNPQNSLAGLGEAKVRQVHAALCEEGECAFTTVQTLLRIMAAKGLAQCGQKTDGRALVYSPAHTREQCQRPVLAPGIRRGIG